MIEDTKTTELVASNQDSAFLSKGKVFYITLYSSIILVRIVFSIILILKYPSSFYYPDTDSYMIPAQQISEGNGFLNESGPEIFRTPGYPLFLAPCFLFKFPIVWYVALLQFFMTVFCAYIVFRLIYLIVRNVRSAHLGALFTLTSPDLLLFQHAILSDIFFTTLLTLSVYLLACWTKKMTNYYLVMAYLFIAASAFIRPISVYLPYGLALCIVYIIIKLSKPSQKVMRLLILVGLIFCHYFSVNLWKTRNFHLTGSSEFASVQSVNMTEYLAASIHARALHESWQETRKYYGELYSKTSIQDRERFSKSLLLETVVNYPFESLVVYIKGFFLNVFDPGASEWLGFLNLRSRSAGLIYIYTNSSLVKFIKYLYDNEPKLLIATCLGFVVISLTWIFFFIGIFETKKHAINLINLFFVLYILIISSGPQSLSRFRIPIIPIILAYSAIGVAKYCKNPQKT